jgi:hypothetical protein
VVLDPSTGELLMVHPFSAVPTAFRETQCGCCGDAMTLTIRNGGLEDSTGVVHVAVPARDWWRDNRVHLKNHAALPE